MLRLVANEGATFTPRDEIVASARAFADMVERGDLDCERVILCAVVDGLAQFTCFGPTPSIVEGVGLLELVKAKIIEGSWT